MQTVITERGQISIPSDVRKKLNLKAGMGMEWVVTERGIYLYPIPADPIQSFRGSLNTEGKGPNLFDELMKERQKERSREKEKK
ncbi:MAG: AbrB/MazE/SpoVT family DNA-binding domain-containing protein [Deltaproteobacteria bacterium]|nr:MAG: AbrB/MazE/SpoVT family DNA-binding domain-containing protein [Deltaproteobacteria bacterium]